MRRPPLVLALAAAAAGCSLGDLDYLSEEGPRSPRCVQPLPGCAGGALDCCATYVVPGGRFPMGDGLAEGSPDERPEHDRVVDPFALDAFEVTVGRFRRFVEQYGDWIATVQAGDGRHPLVEGTGWDPEWNPKRPGSRADLERMLRCGGAATWTATPGISEERPINCVSWHVAFLFCLWDGGRLPTEAEWEFAAAGGAQNRRFPWGAEPPPEEELRAYLGPHCPGGTAQGCKLQDVLHAGSAPKTRGRYGHQDLAANVSEWVLDVYGAQFYGVVRPGCPNCVNLDRNEAWSRVRRGSSFRSNDPADARVAARQRHSAESYHESAGFRCARPAR